MAIPTDRGFVLTRTNADGTHQVEVYAGLPRAGSRPFAVYSGIGRVVVRPGPRFTTQGGGRVSSGPVEVSWSETDGAVYITEPAQVPL